MRRKVIFIFRSPCPLLNAQNKSQSISLSQRRISIEQWSIIGECNKKNENSLSISLSQRMMSSRVHSVATKAKRQADAIKRKNTERMICNRENISVISSPIWRQDCCQLFWDWDYKGTPPKPDNVLFQALQRLFWKIHERKRLKSGHKG